MATEPNANDSTEVTSAAEPKTFFEQAQEALGNVQEAIGDAFENTVEAAKEHPVAAAAIAAGAAAAVAGAAYGVSQLLGGDEDEGKK